MDIKVLKKNNLSLYYYGDITLLNERVIAVIGKRDVNNNVLETSYKVGCWLAQNHFVVLNGLAIGCDKKAVEGALQKKGKVIAVLPCGIDRIYPASCKDIAKEILNAGGLIISQFPQGVGVDKRKFIERDKTQALLSNKIISIYCDEDGGTMHTLRYAKKENKDIGCVIDSPGNIYAINKLNAKKINNERDVISFADGEFYTQLSLFDASQIVSI